MGKLTLMLEEEVVRLDEQMRELEAVGKLTKCGCGWARMRKRLGDGSVVEFCNNLGCPALFREVKGSQDGA